MREREKKRDALLCLSVFVTQRERARVSDVSDQALTWAAPSKGGGPP